MKIKLMTALVAFLLTFNGMIGNSLGRSLDLNKAQWYGCIDREDCRRLSEGLKSKLKENGRGSNALFDLALSTLLSEYLRPQKSPINFNLIENVRDWIKGFESGPHYHLIQSMIFLIMGDQERARNQLEYADENSISVRLIRALSFKGENREFTKHASNILRSEFIPFLALGLGKRALSGGECKVAKKYLDPLVKQYDHHPQVVATWAEAEMDCDNYSKKILSKLQRIYKKDPQSWDVVAQMVRYYGKKSDMRRIENFISQIDINLVDGQGGSDLLYEWARFEFKAGRIWEAERLLKKAIEIDPKNAMAYQLLGKINLLEKRDLPKAIAYLKYYIQLSVGTPDAEKLSVLVARLQEEI